MNLIPAVAKIGAAIGHISTARERLSSRHGYTFTQAEIDYLIEQLNQAGLNCARGLDLLAEAKL